MSSQPEVFPPRPDRILRRREVEQRVGLSRSAIYRRIARKEFPAPLDLGGGMSGWRESAINQWVHTRIPRVLPL